MDMIDTITRAPRFNDLGNLSPTVLLQYHSIRAKEIYKTFHFIDNIEYSTHAPHNIKGYIFNGKGVK